MGTCASAVLSQSQQLVVKCQAQLKALSAPTTNHGSICVVNLAGCRSPLFTSTCISGILLTCLPSVQVATLTEELENSRGGVRDQLKEKDAKINSLIEELGNSQAMLNDKVAELAEVRVHLPYAESNSCPTSWPPKVQG